MSPAYLYIHKYIYIYPYIQIYIYTYIHIQEKILSRRSYAIIVQGITKKKRYTNSTGRHPNNVEWPNTLQIKICRSKSHVRIKSLNSTCDAWHAVEFVFHYFWDTLSIKAFMFIIARTITQVFQFLLGFLFFGKFILKFYCGMYFMSSSHNTANSAKHRTQGEILFRFISGSWPSRVCELFWLKIIHCFIQY